jgi:hypothetical protein
MLRAVWALHAAAARQSVRRSHGIQTMPQVLRGLGANEKFCPALAPLRNGGKTRFRATIGFVFLV